MFLLNILADKRLAQMLETEDFQAELRAKVEELFKDPGLSQLQLHIRCNILLELMNEIEALVEQNCRRDKFRGEIEGLIRESNIIFNV